MPSRVVGLADVTEVAIWTDRIELLSGGAWVTHRFIDIARWPAPRWEWWMWRLLYRLGARPRSVYVADRDWFHEPADMFFEFYTKPPLKVCMPRDEVKSMSLASCFGRVKAVLAVGGFKTYDLG